MKKVQKEVPIEKVHLLITNETRFNLFKSSLGDANTQTWKDVREDLARIKDLNAKMTPNDEGINASILLKSSIVALEIISQCPGLLIIDLDLQMKNLNGYDMFRCIKFTTEQMRINNKNLVLDIPAIYILGQYSERKSCHLNKLTDYIRLSNNESPIEVRNKLLPKMHRLLINTAEQYKNHDWLGA